jgi:hypothetical protein
MDKKGPRRKIQGTRLKCGTESYFLNPVLCTIRHAKSHPDTQQHDQPKPLFGDGLADRIDKTARRTGKWGRW